jgi:hypothetical protein
MKQALAAGRDRLLAAQERQKKNADRHRRELKLDVGDEVLLSADGLKLSGHGNKLCSPFVGPFRIVGVVNANAFTLDLPPQLQALHPTFNISKLKPYRDGRAAFPDRPQRFDRPPPAVDADSNGDTEWIVERILAKKTTRAGEEHYLVQWRGYPPENNTWEPYENVADCEALDEFERAQASGD